MGGISLYGIMPSTNKPMVIPIFMPKESGTRILNFICFVLWRSKCIPIIAPILPIKKPAVSSVVSLMRHIPLFARDLSTMYSKNVITLQMATMIRKIVSMVSALSKGEIK